MIGINFLDWNSDVNKTSTDQFIHLLEHYLSNKKKKIL